MALVESLCKLAGERSALLVDARSYVHRQLLDGLDQRAAALVASISDAEAQVSETHVQRQDGEAFRGKLRQLACKEPCAWGWALH